MPKKATSKDYVDRFRDKHKAVGFNCYSIRLDPVTEKQLMRTAEELGYDVPEGKTWGMAEIVSDVVTFLVRSHKGPDKDPVPSSRRSLYLLRVHKIVKRLLSTDKGPLRNEDESSEVGERGLTVDEVCEFLSRYKYRTPEEVKTDAVAPSYRWTEKDVKWVKNFKTVKQRIQELDEQDAW